MRVTFTSRLLAALTFASQLKPEDGNGSRRNDAQEERALLVKKEARSGRSKSRLTVMSTYDREIGPGTNIPVGGELQTVYADKYTLSETMLYGSSRLGVDNRNIILTTATLNQEAGSGNLETGTNFWVTNLVQLQIDETYRLLDQKFYELSNHLGNVLEVITDRKVSWDEDGNGIDERYIANVVSYSDYYPYGMLMDGRHGSANSDKYRYGFNGMEGDDEVKGEGNSYTTEFRQYDSRIGRWLSLDPLMASYSGQSAYAAFNNNPIYFADPTGLEGEPSVGETRTENDVQQIYTGVSDGWQNASKITSLQNTSGDGIFVRAGGVGEYSYQLITNIVISIDAPLAIKGAFGSEEYSGPIESSDTWVIASGDIESANELYSKTFGTNKIGNLIIDTHGGAVGGNYTGGTDRMRLETSYDKNGNATAYITRNEIGQASDGRNYNSDESNYKDAEAFNSLISNVSKGGLIVLSGCNAGKDHFLVQQIAWSTSANVSVYANRDQTGYLIRPDAITIRTNIDEVENGWIFYGVKNPDKVKNGASPKYGLVKDGSGTMNIDIDGTNSVIAY